MLLLAATPAFAGTYYVSTTGATTGDGSVSMPWPSVSYALSRVGRSNTIALMPGDYQPFRIDGGYGGTATAPTIIKSQYKWKARIRSFTDFGIVTDSQAPYVVLDGFEIQGANMCGIYLQANYSVIRNCWIHNNANQGIGAYTLVGTVIDSNLIEFNGQFPHFHHGVYADGDRLTVCNNIIRYNTGLGLQLYPALTNSRVYNNLVTNQPAEIGILIACPPGGGRNQVYNNTSCNNGSYGIRIWGGNGEIIANNICTGNKSGQVMGNDSNVGTTNTVLVNNFTTGDPKFVDPEKGIFWLQSTSPAIGKGNAAYAPPSNFWNLPGASALDQGAFAYKASLTNAALRSSWPNGYAFRRRRDTAGMEMPDLWISPQ